MRKLLLAAGALIAVPVIAEGQPARAPSEIAAAAPKADWAPIAASDLLVMDLAPDAKGKPRRVVIQLMPAPFSQGWVGNIRELAAAKFWDGTAVNRVQDNYVVQWGDPDAEDKAKAKKLPAGLLTVPEDCYVREYGHTCDFEEQQAAQAPKPKTVKAASVIGPPPAPITSPPAWKTKDAYGTYPFFLYGWPFASRDSERGVPQSWPVHCYGMVGVGRDLSPNTGSGAELYVVIGHAPRHLDRNIALVGRVIEGIEHLSSLPRGHGALGFYDPAQGDERTAIVSIRLGSEVKDLPAYEYLSTESASFAQYADARANRRDAFFIRPAGGADICNIPVPVRRVAEK